METRYQALAAWPGRVVGPRPRNVPAKFMVLMGVQCPGVRSTYPLAGGYLQRAADRHRGRHVQ